MQEFDDVDREIVNLLLENSRRPYSDIADHVGLSAPAVSDRIAKLQEQGIIQRFTLRLDQTQLVEDGLPVLVHLQPRPHIVEDVVGALKDNSRVELLFTTADGDIYFTATIRPAEGSAVLLSGIEDGTITEHQVKLLADSTWNPRLTESFHMRECTACGKPVPNEEWSIRIGDERYVFCCPTCKSRFSEQDDEEVIQRTES